VATPNGVRIHVAEAPPSDRPPVMLVHWIIEQAPELTLDRLRRFLAG
jgi:hypothetical protein